MTYAPHSGSLAAKVVKFFDANPEEELTREDIAAKFDVKATSVITLLRPSIEAGLLTRDVAFGDGRRCVWRKGQGGKSFEAANELPAFPAAGPAPGPNFSAVADLTPARPQPAAPAEPEARPLVALADQLRERTDAQPPEPAIRGARAAVWSSGELAIETTDRQVILFPAAVAREVIAFLKRVEIPA
jgi:hypothetical protein